eukprot:1087540-Rhodomonas_salina.2
MRETGPASKCMLVPRPTSSFWRGEVQGQRRELAARAGFKGGLCHCELLDALLQEVLRIQDGVQLIHLLRTDLAGVALVRVLGPAPQLHGPAHHILPYEQAFQKPVRLYDTMTSASREASRCIKTKKKKIQWAARIHQRAPVVLSRAVGKKQLALDQVCG